MKRYLFYIVHNYCFEVLRPLQTQIRKQGGEVVWFVEGDEINTAYFTDDEIRLTSIAEVVDYKPRAVFAPGNLVPDFIPGLKVCVFHGFVGYKTRLKDNVNYHFIIRDCFDLYCTHGHSSTFTFKELAQQHGHFQVAETGYCKMDPYFNGTYSAPETAERPTVLFSSTFSPRMTQARFLKKTIEALSKDHKWRWKVTFHPKMDKSTVEEYKAMQHDNLLFVETDKLAPHMVEADLMLGDNSSMITDFLLLNKPVVTFNNEAPKPYLNNITDVNQLESALAYGLSRPPELMQNIAEFAQLTHPYTDGLSSLRVLLAVEEAIVNLPNVKPKPVNLIRNLKLRYKFSYWKF